MVPKTWVKFIVGIFLLPVIWILTTTFLDILRDALQHGLLRTEGCLFFLSGIILWVLLFWLLPRPWFFFLYVYGHECTHAIWVKIFGGKVGERFHVGEEGGHILADRVNTWIALSPYFFPIYSALVMSIYGMAAIFTPVAPFQWLMFLLLGLTWAFHLTFTCILIVKGQPDLHYGGTFFSMSVIYVINLLIVTVLVLTTAPHISLDKFGERILVNTEQLVSFIALVLQQASFLIQSTVAHLKGSH